MKTQTFIAASLAAPLLLLCAWPRASIAQAAIGYAVVSWGDGFLTTVPVAAQSGVTAIAAGYYYTVALKNDGSVVSWGSLDQTTVPVAAQSGVTAIAAGHAHTVALKNDSAVVAWGSNEYGQTTVPVAAQGGVTAIAAGWGHTVALKNDGSVVAWGFNGSGQTTVPVAARSGVTAIAAGDYHTVALKADGSVVAWGLNDYGQTTVPVAVRSGVTAIAAGGNQTLALKNDGSVVSWGSLGQTTVPVAAQSGVTAIAAGGAHAVALRNDGTVVAWGHNGYGQTTVPVVAQSGVAAIGAGSWHTVALVIPTAPNITTQPAGQAVHVWQSASFTVGATGYPLNYQWRKDGVDLAGATSATYTLTLAQTNQAGSYTVVVSNPLGSVTSAPPAVLTVNPAAAPGTVVAWGRGGTTVPIAAQSGVTAIAAGGYCILRACYPYTMALKDDGSVVAWENNNQGRTTVSVATQSGVTAIAAGYDHTVALKNDGSVVVWGGNDEGQTIPLAAQSGVTAIAAGYNYTVALKNDGSVVAWGGCCGQTDVPITAQSGVAAIAAGMWHAVALKNDGTVVSWGDNSAGQVTGTRSDETSATPVILGGEVLSGVTAIAAGSWHTVALKNDGSVVAWGYDGYGEVTGTPTTDSAIARPVRLGGQVLSGVTAIAAGQGHTVALKKDGTVVEWGATVTPTTDDPSSVIASPVTLEGQVLSGVTAIAAGVNHSVALIGGVQLLPSLKARPNGNELILSWPTNALGFTLQSTLDLTPPVTWLDSTSGPAVVGAHFTLTNTTTGGARFYRLKKM